MALINLLLDAPCILLLRHIVEAILNAYLDYATTCGCQSTKKSVFYLFQTGLVSIHNPEGMKGSVALGRKSEPIT